MKNKKTVLKSASADELERALDKCLVWFYAFPNAKIGLNDLSKSIGSSKTTTKKAVESLIEISFLSKQVVGKSWLLSVDQKHPYFLIKKVPYHLSKIYESGVLDFIYKIIPQPRAIVLFGSYRWGTDVEESDVDIAVEVLDSKDLEIIKLGTIPKLGYRKNIVVNIHIFSRNKIDLNLFANIANGILLDGFLEVRP
tara:strand:+ start:468 stop:1055 length:588 start_codon:yes stop_codon:yes gene_type:complete